MHFSIEPNNKTKVQTRGKERKKNIKDLEIFTKTMKLSLLHAKFIITIMILLQKQKADLTVEIKDLTFRDGALDIGALGDDAVVIDTFLLFNQVIAVTVLAVVPRATWRMPLGGELHARDKQPLDQRESYSNHGAHRHHDLRRQVRQQCRPHRRRTALNPPATTGTEREFE